MTGHFTALEVIAVYVILGSVQLYCCFNIAQSSSGEAMIHDALR